jgi:hypothetical protein
MPSLAPFNRLFVCKSEKVALKAKKKGTNYYCTLKQKSIN